MPETCGVGCVLCYATCNTPVYRMLCYALKHILCGVLNVIFARQNKNTLSAKRTMCGSSESPRTKETHQEDMSPQPAPLPTLLAGRCSTSSSCSALSYKSPKMLAPETRRCDLFSEICHDSPVYYPSPTVSNAVP